jgi:hypothetical protein
VEQDQQQQAEQPKAGQLQYLLEQSKPAPPPSPVEGHHRLARSPLLVKQLNL